MIDRTHYDAVLKDLRENHDILKGNLEEMETAIRVLNRMYAKPPKSLKEVTTGTVRISADSGEFTLAAAKHAVHPFEIGLTEAIVRAATLGIYTQSKLIDCVMEMRPGTTRPSALSMVNMMLSKQRLHKGEDLIIRNVKDGKVRGIPLTSTDAVKSQIDFGSYRTQ
jgi:hypothetical protein